MLAIFVATCISGCASFFVKKIEKPHYWIAQKGSSTFYIVGTIHRFISIHELPDYIPEQLKNSEVVIVESDNSQAGAYFKKLLRWDAHQSSRLQKNLSPGDWQAFKTIYIRSPFGKQLQKRNVRPTDCGYFVGSMILASYMEDNLNRLAQQIRNGSVRFKKTFEKKLESTVETLSSSAQLDNELIQIATNNQITISFLDRSENKTQNLLQKIYKTSFEEQLHELRPILGNEKEIFLYFYKHLNGLAELVSDYRAGKPIFKSSDGFKNYEDELLRQRNEDWADRIERLSTVYQHGFIAVGTLHLYGKNNLLQILESRGFRVFKHAPTRVH